MITQIRLVNCQSWEDITIDLATDRLNVVVAENDTGKSVLFKLLKIAGSPKYYSREDRKDLIRWGCNFAVIVLAFDDGTLAAVTIRSNQVIYDFYWEDNTFLRSIEPSKEMLERMGLLVGDNGKFIANIIDGDQDLLLVNSNLSSNFELIRMIVLNNDLDSLQEKLQEYVTEFNNYWVRATDQKVMLQSQLDSMEKVDVPALERSLHRHEEFLFVLRGLVQIWYNVEKFNELEYKNYDTLEKFLSVLMQLEKLPKLLSQLKTLPEPPDYRLLLALESLEALKLILGRINPLVSKNTIELLHWAGFLISVMEKVKNLSIKKWDGVKMDVLCDQLIMLERVSTLAKQLQSAIKVMSSAKEDEQVIYKQIVERGSEYDCPIYGKVIFDGKECMVSN